MARGKHLKSKPSRQAKQSCKQSKKGGNEAYATPELRAQLDALGLKIIQVTADGNCFFRALADQLDGNDDEHEKYRSMVAGFIENNREMFEPFIEDEVPFDEYCVSIGECGTWAGNMELQAASLVTRTNICIHRCHSPRWYIQNFDVNEARLIHLSYHDGEHYNSVRSKDDDCSGPAKPIVIKGAADISEKSNQSKASTLKSKHESGGKGLHEESITIVKYGSGCEDVRKVEQALQEVGGDVDAAIEVLIAEQESLFLEDQNHDTGDSEPTKLIVEENTCEPDLSGKLKEKIHKNNPPTDEKKISRNKTCLCGSKKKYKSCCGSVAAKSSGRFPFHSIQTVNYEKNRKDRKQGRMGGSTILNANESLDGLPDVGAICI